MIGGLSVIHSIVIKLHTPDCSRYVYKGEMDFPQLLAYECILYATLQHPMYALKSNVCTEITGLNVNFQMSSKNFT